MMLIAGHCRRHPSRGCRATLSLTCKDKHLRGRTLAVQPHLKYTEGIRIKSAAITDVFSFHFRFHCLLNILPDCIFCNFVFLLWAKLRERRQTILAQDLSSLQRWSHNAVRETTFKVPPFTPPPLLHYAVNDSMLLGGCSSLISQIRARSVIIGAILLIDKPSTSFLPHFFSDLRYPQRILRSHNLPYAHFPVLSHFLSTHSCYTLLGGQSSIHRYQSALSHTCYPTSSVIGCMPTLLRPQERYNDRPNDS
jgi:hypothetical protein